MTEVVPNQARSRSDSFQRMLDLEKRMMLHRRESSTSNSHHSTPAGSVPPSPLPQPRRFELVPKDGKKAPPPPVRNYGPLQPQLFTSSTAPVNADADPSAAIKRKPVAHARSVSMSIAMMEKAPIQKNVAFAFPPEVQEPRAVSQSPAPVQQKKGEKEVKREVKKEAKKEVKKEDKKKEEEKKGKEPAAKEKPRGRRLSKAPPTYLTPSVQGRTTTEPVKEKSRSSSLLGITIGRRDTSRDDATEKPKRGRSGSLTSVIRGSFEIRRGSWDQTSASGFLGGVKLEKKKQDFTKQVLDDQANGSSSVHPALRKSFLGHGSFTPLKASPEPEKEADSQRRAYPPISINNAGGMNSTASSPKTPKPPHSRRGSSGSSNIYLWSARARKKFLDQSDECAVADDEDEPEQQIKNDSPVDPPSMPKESIGLTRRGGVHIKNVSSRGAITSKFQTEFDGQTGTTEPEAIKPLNIAKKDIPKIKTTAPEPEPEPIKETIIEHKNHTAHPPASSKTPEQRESRASPQSPKAPAPPRKSSKRHSTPPLSRSQTTPVEGCKDDSSRTSKESTRSDKIPLASVKPSSAKRNPNPPSIRYETTLAGVRPTPYSGGSPTSPSANWSPTKPIGSRGNSSESLSPTSTSRSFSPSPLQTEIVATAADAQLSTQTSDVKLTSANKRNSRPSAERLAPIQMAHPALRRPRTSSSDESLYSDALQTPSGPDTPDTSPPQSDSGYKLNGEKRMTQYSPYWSMENSPELGSTDRFQVSDAPNSEDDVDPIEAAARRVMEAFSNANLRSPALSHREDSSGDSSLPSTPIIDTQPRLRHKAKSKGRLRPANIQTVKLSQTANGPKAVRSTPNLDVRGHKSGQPASEASSQSKPNPQRGEKVGKVFVVCCECKRYHDIPTRLYKTMLNPGGVFDQADTKGFEDRVCMTVKCSWCDHLMSTKCCPGVSSILEVQARVH